MRLAAALLVATLTACGGSSALQQTAGGPASQAPLQDASVTPPASAEPSSSDVVYPPEPASAQAMATAGIATAGTATSGPGRLSSPGPSPSPRPAPSPVAGTVTVTDGDSGSTVHLSAGQRLRVRLSQGTWDPPVSSADSLLQRRSSTGGYPTDQPVDATFAAVGRGSATVSAQSDAACFHTSPRCLMASRQWQVTVVVR